MDCSAKQITNKKTGTFLLIFLGWLVYSVSYFGKVNYSANITQVIEYYGVTKAQAGIAPTFFFFAYGIGQVFNGFCYMGSTISSYGLGVIADNFGWVSVFYVLAAFCVAVCVIYAAYKLIKKFSKDAFTYN